MSGRASSAHKGKKKLLKWFAELCPGCGVRIWLLRKCGYRIGSQVYVGEHLVIIDDLEDDSSSVVIGDRVAVAPRVTFVAHSSPNWSRIAPFVGGSKGTVVVEQDAWIGTGAVILPGVRIGEGAVVGANAVVTKDVAPYTVVGGVPARVLKSVDVPWRGSGAAQPRRDKPST